MQQLYRSRKDIRLVKTQEHDSPNVRQGFLNTLQLENTARYVKRVVYDPSAESFTERDGSVVHPDTVYMLTIPSWRSRVGLGGGRSIIKVLRGAFDKCENPDDFLSALIDHEGYHAQEHYKRSQANFLRNVLDVVTLGLYGLERRVRMLENPFEYKDPSELRIESEIRARENQLRMIESGKRNCSEQFIDTIKKELAWLRRASVA